jgi:Flp pilus assembly protein TadD
MMKQKKRIRFFWLLVALSFLVGGCAAHTPAPGFDRDALAREAAARQRFVSDTPQPRHLDLAVALINKGFYEVALGALKNAAANGGSSARIDCLMGRCLRETGRLDEAENRFRTALKKDNGYAPAHNGLGLTLDLCGRPAAARACYQRAIALNPARPDFYNNLGYSEILAGRIEAGRRHLQKSLALGPASKKTVNNLALCHVMEGHDPKALALLSQTFSRAAAHANLGVFHQILGNPEKAAVFYRRALVIDADCAVALNNLEKIKK